MKCNQCEYDNNCKLKEIYNDLTGCDGHSKIREIKEGEVKCSCCGQIVNVKECFSNKGIHICFKCY